MPWLKGLLVASLLFTSATAAAAASPSLARQALDSKLDEPEVVQRPRLRLEVGSGPDLQEQLIGLLPGETLEDVARTLASRKVELKLSSERAVLVVRLPLG